MEQPDDERLNYLLFADDEEEGETPEAPPQGDRQSGIEPPYSPASRGRIEAPVQPVSAGEKPPGEQPLPARDFTSLVPDLSGDDFTEAERKQLQGAFESFEPEQMFNANVFIQRRLLERDRQAQAAVAANLTGIAPAFVSVNRPALEAFFSRIPPQQRATREAVDAAIAYATNVRGQQIGLAKAYAEAAQLLGDIEPPYSPASGGRMEAQATTPALVPRAAPAIIPPESRMATPTVAAQADVSRVNARRGDYDLRKLSGIPGFSDPELFERARKDLGFS